MIVTKKSNKQSLNVHIKSFHEQKNPFKCDDCDILNQFMKKRSHSSAAFSQKGHLIK